MFKPIVRSENGHSLGTALNTKNKNRVAHYSSCIVNAKAASNINDVNVSESTFIQLAPNCKKSPQAGSGRLVDSKGK